MGVTLLGQASTIASDFRVAGSRYALVRTLQLIQMLSETKQETVLLSKMLDALLSEFEQLKEDLESHKKRSVFHELSVRFRVLKKSFLQLCYCRLTYMMKLMKRNSLKEVKGW